jgi:hypothetical protein
VRDRTRRNNGVGIEEDEDCAATLQRPAVRASREPEVLAGRDNANALSPASVVDLRSPISVVDDDYLVGLVGK